MKRVMTCMVLSLLAIAVAAQTSKEAKQWLKKSEWSSLKKAKPHKTLNIDEFYRQYQKNKEQWDVLYQWLCNTDLLAIPKGKHPIEGSTLVASVEDSENGPLEKRGTESHRKKIDFQLVVKGTEGFALLDHESSTVKIPYDDKKDVMRYNFVKEKTNFFDVKAGQFVIFFPTDWHIAKLHNQKKNDDQKIRVIVVKMDYKE
ncbi:MAG: YhcH/YjgK/YiaL family protein [Prevotella sp.]|nr:YhcH/YjgK/YiaL family protein [Prevotella sp.]